MIVKGNPEMTAEKPLSPDWNRPKGFKTAPGGREIGRAPPILAHAEGRSVH